MSSLVFFIAKIVEPVVIGVLLYCTFLVCVIAIDRFKFYAHRRRVMAEMESDFARLSQQRISFQEFLDRHPESHGSEPKRLPKSIGKDVIGKIKRDKQERWCNPMTRMFYEAYREWSKTGHSLHFHSRLERLMDASISREVLELEKRLLVLATVGSAGPFIGLLGTVFGIMGSFQSIANSGNADFTTIAPGLAYALFATALGLAAAIPATILYNKFNSEVSRQVARLDRFANDLADLFAPPDRVASGNVAVASLRA